MLRVPEAVGLVEYVVVVFDFDFGFGGVEIRDKESWMDWVWVSVELKLVGRKRVVQRVVVVCTVRTDGAVGATLGHLRATRLWLYVIVVSRQSPIRVDIGCQAGTAGQTLKVSLACPGLSMGLWLCLGLGLGSGLRSRLTT